MASDERMIAQLAKLLATRRKIAKNERKQSANTTGYRAVTSAPQQVDKFIILGFSLLRAI
ncbi:hypothetical protein A6U87_15425 [Rhizobium sp. AC44/96]|nr:hypothetical protein A6U87_15425 [Rhizobium sp. AC44/96]